MSEGPRPVNPDALALACCIERARRLADGDESPSSDVYWHTREAAVRVAVELGLPITSVISLLPNVQGLTSTAGPRAITMSGREIRLNRSLVDDSARFWADVAHPDVLVQEVMEA